VRGVPGYDHLLPDLSFATLEKEHARERDALEQLQGDRRQGAARAGPRLLWLLRDKMETSVEAQRFEPRGPGPLDARRRAERDATHGADHALSDCGTTIATSSSAISATPKFAHETIERLRAGMKSGWMSPVPVLDRVVAAIDAHVRGHRGGQHASHSFQEFRERPSRGRARGTDRCGPARHRGDYQPALRRFKAFIVNEYRPKAPQVAGLAALPGGAEYYEFLIRTRVVRGMKGRRSTSWACARSTRLAQGDREVALQTGFKGTTDAFHRKPEDGQEILL